MGFLRETFSERGTASSKRVLGGICLLTVLAVWCVDTFRNGLGSYGKELAEMMVGVSGLLLGISSVTSVFKTYNGEDKEEVKEADS